MGFQFCSSLLQVFQVIGISLASYSLLWDAKRPSSTTISGAASNLFTSGQYVINPEERAKQIFKVTLNADIAFCKAFWNLTEGRLLQELPRWFSPNLAVNEIWQVPGDLVLNLETNDGRQTEVPPPTAYTGPRNLPIRVLSYHCRDGMSASNVSPRVLKIASTAGNVLPKSPNLVFHVHGGGFVATSSKTHEPYLRHWAKSLNCPVVSVDYSLAPEHPYPRASEEVYYAYAWVLANAEKLGWTGERICLAGDSAGGLLLASTTLRLIKRNIKRLPDGLVLIYPAFLAQYSPSPSRLLSLLDPLLPMGVVSRCLAAYTGNIEYLKNDSPTSETSSKQEKTGSQSESPSGPTPKKSLSRVQEDSECNKSPSRTPASDQEILNFFKRSFHNGIKESGSGTELAVDAAMEVDPLNEEPGSNDKPGFSCGPPSENGDENETSQQIEDSKIEQQTDAISQFFHRQLSRTSGKGRTRSQSEMITSMSSGKDQNEADSSSTTSSDYSEEEDVASTIAANVPKDPKIIVFSVANHDEAFLDYLRDHETTKNSFRRLQAPSSVSRHPSGEQDEKKIYPSNACSPSDDMKSSTSSQGSQSSSGHYRSQSAGSLASLTRASANIGHRMGLYVLDNVNGWFNPGIALNARVLLNGSAGSSNSPKLNVDSPLSKFHDMPVPKDPFLSPLLAPEEWLAKFPRTCILACHLDPLLDDAVSFAKRVKRSGANVSLDLVDSLPHGFLNFALYSAECREAGRMCVQRMREILNIGRDKS